MRILKKITILSILFWQKFLSLAIRQINLSVFGYHSYCPQEPTCSQYCLEQVREHGTILGLRRGISRVLSCGKNEDNMSQIMAAVLFVLIQLYLIFNNLGWAIVAFTLLIRSLLAPLSVQSIKAQQKIRELQPELQQLKKKHAGSKEKLQKAQVELYQRYNINPLAGCLPQLAQIAVLIVLYQVLIRFLQHPEVNGVSISTQFFWLDLAKPDSLYILPVLAGLSQLLFSLMIAPGAEQPDLVKNQSLSKKTQDKNKKEEDFAEMAASMQQQMLFIMPVMTAFIALRFPSGLALYWVLTTLFSIGQQYLLSGPGGLVSYWQRGSAWLAARTNQYKGEK